MPRKGIKYGYARTSTLKQNLGRQLASLEREECDVIVQEQESAVKERPEFTALMGKLKRGDTLVCHELDRIGRSTIGLLTIVDTLRKKGVNFVAVKERIDTSTELGMLFFTITAAFAQYERAKIVERAREGLILAYRKGKRSGPKFKHLTQFIRCEGDFDECMKPYTKWVNGKKKKMKMHRTNYYEIKKIARDYHSMTRKEFCKKYNLNVQQYKNSSYARFKQVPRHILKRPYQKSGRYTKT